MRRQRVLSIVVQEYTRSAQPVASTAIAQRYDLGVSAATIRNDLAALENDGLLTHPHTSAGRIPTDAGYRYFVQHLISDAELPLEEQEKIQDEFREARQDLDQWLRVSTAVLARASRGAALATAPRAVRSRFKHMELVAIQGTKVLLVLVLQEGAVKQQLLDLDAPMEQSELSQISNALNDTLQGASAQDLMHRLALLDMPHPQDVLTRQVAALVAEIMERLDTRVGGQIYRDGLAQILDAPEFAEGASVRRVVRVFEQRSLLQQVLGDFLEENEIQVVIAGDGRYAELQNVSLILGSYGISERAMGVLGVMGPMRMSYGRGIGAVRFVGALMSEMLEDVYGH